MPIYAYRCSDCDYRSEALRSHDTKHTDLDCSECGGSMVYTISAPAPHRMGGAEGKLITANKARQRSLQHQNSPTGLEENRHNVKTAHERHNIR